MHVLLFVFLSSLLGVNCVVVNINDGPINGTTDRSRSGRLFHKFMTVPYAKPPVGDLRFKPPVVPEPWTEVKDATNQPPKCIQFYTSKNGSVQGQEDCLYLNVYVPVELFNTSQKYPVVVAIHGGAFILGSSNDYQSDYFMERDVILVTVNYRLGTLGFFGLNTDSISGNFGLKDQSLALKWVNANIALFGGDSQNVTIFGESAGAVSVHLHQFSPLSKGLFQKAIMDSGSAYAQWASFPSMLRRIVKSWFLTITGCERIYSENVLKCLQKKSAEDFVTKYGLESNVLFLPMVEDKVTNEPFLAVKPNLTNYITRVPTISGINSAEGALIMMSRFTPILNLYVLSAGAGSDKDEISNMLKIYYFRSEDIGLETVHEAVNMMTDSAFLYPLRINVESNLDQPSLQQYVYLYDHRGSISLQDIMNPTIDLGVCHADEIPMLFRYKRYEDKRTLQDKKVSETMLKHWINFAISEDPNRHSVEKIWQPVSSDKVEYLHITSDNATMKTGIFGERYNLWCNLPTGWLNCKSAQKI